MKVKSILLFTIAMTVGALLWHLGGPPSETARLRAELGKALTERDAAIKRARENSDSEKRLRITLAAMETQVASANWEAEEQLEAWIDRVGKLRAFLAHNPQLAIPEMKRLRAVDWLDATKETSLRTEADLRLALAKLRGTAKNLSETGIYDAIRESIKANNGQPPADIATIAKYLKDPGDFDILKRYTLNPAGDIPGLRKIGPHGPQGVKAMLIETPVDAVWDTQRFYTIDGPGMRGINEYASRSVQDATIEYRRIHGSDPSDSTQLTELLKGKLEPRLVDEIFNAQRTPVPAPGQ